MSEPKHITLTANVTLDASVQADGAPKSRTFKLDPAYSGGTFNQPWSSVPIVADLAGMTVDARNGQLPVLAHHDLGQWAGVIEAANVVNDGKTLRASGELFEAGDETADMVLRKGKKANWQASIGASIGDLESIEAGDTATVNGQTFDGPVLVARQTSLVEISFTPLGADSQTSAAVFAARTKPESEAAPVADPKTPDALAALRDRNATIQAEFKTDPEFALSAITGTDSLEALRLKFAQKQIEAAKAEAAAAVAAAAELQTQLDAAKAAPVAPVAPVVSAAGIGGVAPAPGSAKDQLDVLVRAEIARMKEDGVALINRTVRCSKNDTYRAMALANVLRKNPQAETLRKQWLAEVNG